MNLLKHLNLRAAASDARILRLDPMPAAIYAVGDVHGCDDLLRDLEAQIITHSANIAGQKLILLLGDMIDRGPGSAAVLDHLLSAPPDGFARMALRGNHEAMLLDFLRAPAPDAPWLRCGGIETLASYGQYPDPSGRFTGGAAQLPASHRAALENMPSALICGDYFFCHAGVDPARAPQAQLCRDLHWRANDTLQGWSGGCIVHGHVPIATPYLGKARINLDTGAHRSGLLSAICLTPDGGRELLQAHRSAWTKKSEQL